MSERTLEVLTERLDRLERENQWWRRVGVSLLLAMVAIATLGQAPARSPGRDAPRPARRLPLARMRAVRRRLRGFL